MKIKITAAGNFGADGEIAVGTILEVKEEPKGWAGRYEVVDAGASSDAKQPAAKPEKVAPADAVAPFEAKHKSGQWYGIVDGQGRDVGKSLKKEEAEAFNALGDEEKAQHVAGLAE